MRINKKHISLVLTAALLLGLCAGFAPAARAAGADITEKFTDPRFRAAVYEVIGKRAPERILDSDVSGVTDLDVHGWDIQSLAGLEYFTGLEVLYCPNNRLISLPALPKGLESLYCDDNQLTSLPALPPGLKTLFCGYNRLTGLDLSGLTALEKVDCTYNDLADTSAVKGFTGVWNSDNFVFEPQNTGYLPLIGLSSWAVAEANSLNERGVIPTALKNNFQTPIRRDEFAALLVKIYENVTRHFSFKEDSHFTDISGSPYKRAIAKAYDYGLVDGTSSDKFTPFGLLTREQTAKLLFTLLNKAESFSLGSGAPDFTDNAAISGWAKPYVAWCQRYNVMQGTATGKFDPQGNLTREQAMLVAERLLTQFNF